MLESLQVSRERVAKVTDEIIVGSHPQWRFYALLITASMIACFGLIANSTAVIIGAMLVSPLMMPIFGIALGMLNGNPTLVGQASRGEVAGVLLAVGSAFLVGLTQLIGSEATTEMVSRTQPNLIDLLVAIFAGFAGAYALVDERISPALPGVAIATAIVPPLSTCGLCLALGDISAAGGALLLFLANFVSILVVSLLVFGFTGLAQSTHVRSWSGFGRRFGATVIGFVAITIVLTNSLVRIARERRIISGIQNTLIAEFSDDSATEVEDFVHNRQNGRVQVLATVRSPEILKPLRVSELQAALSNSLEYPVDLVVRTSVSKDVSPAGAQLHVNQPDRDGKLLTKRTDDAQSQKSLAEQVIREQFQDEPGFEVTQVDYGSTSKGKGIVIAYVNSLRRLASAEVARVEDALRGRLEDRRLMFLVRVNSAQLEHREGPVRIEWTSWKEATPEEISLFPDYESKLREIVMELLDVIPVHVHFNYSNGRKQILIEVVGPKPINEADARLCQNRAQEQLDKAIEIHLWYRTEYVVNAVGVTTYDALTGRDLEQRSRRIRDIFDPKTTTTK